MTEGETWARELLEELRAHRYRPRAWSRFFARSFARARATRAERAREHRQTLLAGAAVIVVWAAVAAFHPWLALAGSAWWLLTIAMVDWHLGMLEDAAGRPLGRLGLPNLLSLVRVAVVPVLLVAAPSLLAAILILAGATDAIDGRLARTRGEETRLGVWLDGGGDALMLSAAAVGAARHDLLPWWAAALVLGWHSLQALAVALAYLLRARSPRRDPSPWARVPGLVLFAGLALASLNLPRAELLVLVGALAALALMVARARRPGGARVNSPAAAVGRVSAPPGYGPREVE